MAHQPLPSRERSLHRAHQAVARRRRLTLASRFRSSLPNPASGTGEFLDHHTRRIRHMPLSMYQASVPTFVQILTALSGVLDKAQACATAKKFDPTILLSSRLAPSMFPMSRQVQIACDFAKGATARLAAAEVPSWPDHEKTFAELQERIRKTTDFVQSFKAAQID